MAKKDGKDAKVDEAPPVKVASDPVVAKHLQFGWWALAVFTTLGLVLEAAHGLKAGWYLDVTNETRRLMFTLGHAHGTLLGLVNIAFAVTLPHTQLTATAKSRASFALRAATVLMPLGFVAGGIVFYAGDPGLGIILVPPAAVVLVIGVAIVARGIKRS